MAANPSHSPSRRRARIIAGVSLTLAIVALTSWRQRRHTPPETDPSTQADLQAVSAPPNETPAVLVRETFYADGTLKSRSDVVDGMLNGVSMGWYTNGQLQVEEHFVDDVSHGVRTRWYPDGIKKSETDIVNGTVDGVHRTWYPNGALANEAAFKLGTPDGVSTAYYESGFIKAIVTMDKGRTLQRESFEDGQRAGPRSRPLGP